MSKFPKKELKEETDEEFEEIDTSSKWPVK